MRSSLAVLGLVVGLLSTLVSSTALTYNLAANEKACFYTLVSSQGAKLAFYFAVSNSYIYLIMSMIANVRD